MKRLYTFFVAIAVATIGLPVFTRATRADARLSVTVRSSAYRVYDVTTFGAKGDGQTLDTPAINKAIETAAAAGGGTVQFPAGTSSQTAASTRRTTTRLYLRVPTVLGFARATENVTVTNCFVSGYDIGSLLDGTYKRNVKEAPDHDGPTGRVKLGTESNGGFKNITICNIVFDHCRGLALETVDGGMLEDVTISNITMRAVVNSPIFLRLGSRMRGPAGTPVGQLRSVNISNIIAYNADPRYASIIAGLPGHDIEDVKLSNIRIYYQGGGTKEQAAVQPPERETNYPEPSMFGDLPAYGFFLRHVKGIELNNIEVSYMKEDLRPAFVLEDVKDVDFLHVKAQQTANIPTFVLKNVLDFTTHQ